ncbi:mechanosensitive ion channel protein [Streptomyces abyssalis]|uniref:Large-conductance mechanosensitive channel n=1 Tax=Streptomyces abyssalis TaxID=933944 RepID=A0A1E7JN13_9ACTN|nr:large conductance mechanosensitive channel protein MscL [Streptomyces abyssalis]OEU86954.1 mechanosensitive ion channel protein [Streptomyces abyssalis]OEU89661.1 mechanosensitive ion channel protein [Streptomyces abyssalis]OEV07165.1 mechanosensitive ion channel protein [Streptomyces nanshensis]
MESEKKGLLTGFKEFLMRGNVVELAVAVVIGTAFSKIVDSLVKGLINPLVGAIGTKDLEKYSFCLKAPCETSKTTGEVTSGVPVNWGPVLSATLTFLITAAVVYFLMILPMTRYKERLAAKKTTPEAPPEVSEVDLLTEIRDLLASERGSSDGRSGGTEVAAGSGGSADTEGSLGQQRDGGGRGVSTEKP